MALADEVEKFETKNASRLEPVIDFLRASRQAKYDAQTENSEDLRNFCKKVGWNLVFAGWNLAEASGAPQAAPPPDGCGSQGGSEGLPPPILGPLGGSAARSACPNPENPPQNGSFSFVADPEAPFLPILPQDLSAVAPATKIFRSQGSKSDPVLHIQYPPPWGDVAQNVEIGKWRCLLQISRKRLVGDK